MEEKGERSEETEKKIRCLIRGDKKIFTNEGKEKTKRREIVGGCAQRESVVVDSRKCSTEIRRKRAEGQPRKEVGQYTEESPTVDGHRDRAMRQRCIDISFWDVGLYGYIARW